jgi:mannitol/fructose-specific phosphotransferase system IIA component (Ntr-type)
VALVPLAPYLAVNRVLDLVATTRMEAVRELCAALARAPEVGDADGLLRAVLEREEVMSTGIGLGIAVPHAKIASVRDFVLAVGRSRAGIDFASLDGRPAHLVFHIAGPEDRQARYLQILASVTLRLKDEATRRALLDAAGPREVLALLGAGE